MSHKIIGQRFISRGRAAWHKLGRLFGDDENINAEEAARQVAGDVRIRAFPTSFEYEEPDAETGSSASPRKSLKTGQRVIVRDPVTRDDDNEKPSEPHVLGFVNDPAWQPQSYVDLAASLNGISNSHKVETAGLINDGGLLFISFRGKKWDVAAGDEMQDYFLANLSQTPNKAHSVMHTPVRTVCANTNNTAIRSATVNLSIPHTPDAAQKIGLAGNLVARFETMHDATQAAFNEFAKAQFSTEQVERVFAAAFPAPPLPETLRMLRDTAATPEQAATATEGLERSFARRLVDQQETWERDCKRQARLRDAARYSFENFDPRRLRGTAWAAYNAVTEISDWREGRGADKSTVWGPRAQEKVRAYSEVATILEMN